jgi:hypothetical protein
MTENNAELNDIKKQFYIIMENYPKVYANYKMNPRLPSAMTEHDKMEANLTAMYRRMFAHQASIDKQLEEHDTDLQKLTTQNAKLNSMLSTQEMTLASMNNTMNDNKKIIKMPIRESFDTITGLANDDAPTQNQLYTVDNARSIEISSYYHSIARIVYLLVGITVVAYFIFKRVDSPDSTILADAKMKADEIKNKVVQPAATYNEAPLK